MFLTWVINSSIPSVGVREFEPRTNSLPCNIHHVTFKNVKRLFGQSEAEKLGRSMTIHYHLFAAECCMFLDPHYIVTCLLHCITCFLTHITLSPVCCTVLHVSRPTLHYHLFAAKVLCSLHGIQDPPITCFLTHIALSPVCCTVLHVS